MIKIRARILDNKKISVMPTHNLKRYKESVRKSSNLLHNSLNEYCCNPPDESCVVLKTRQATEEEVGMIKTLDRIISTIKYECDVRKIRNG